MPPKKPRARSGSRSNERIGSSRRPIEKGTAPTSTRDPTKPQINKELQQRDKKELITSFQKELYLKQMESEKEVRKTLERIHNLQRDNERMQKKQIAEYGMTLDTLEDLKVNLEYTKAQNDKLYEDMANTRELHNKLEVELRDTKKRYSETVKKLEQLERESKVWTTTKAQLLASETRCQDLIRNNKKLRIILLKHHIDPKTDAREINRDNDKESVKSCKTFPETTVKHKRKLTVRGRYNDVGNVETIRRINKEFLKKGFGVHIPDVTFDQVSPAYIGYYLKEMKEKAGEYQDSEYHFREGVTLPRLFEKYNYY